MGKMTTSNSIFIVSQTMKAVLLSAYTLPTKEEWEDFMPKK